jgi:hypothetical protein
LDVTYPPVPLPLEVLAKVKVSGTVGSAVATVKVPLNAAGPLRFPAMVMVCPEVTEQSPTQLTVALAPNRLNGVVVRRFQIDWGLIVRTRRALGDGLRIVVDAGD